jgi:squalene-hopene/tetraprenyl-beta-curcumene cyclase
MLGDSNMTTVPGTQSSKTISVSLETFRDQAARPLLDRAREVMRKSQQLLMGLQKPEGYWVGELLVDSTLISDKVAFMHWCGEVDFDKQSRCVKNLLDRQQPDGGWHTYYKGPSELNATTKAYFALKLAGFSPEDPRMVRAHATIVRLGGIPKANTYTKLFLALFGQYPWKYLPIIPPEIILLPNWLYFNIYEMSSWSRGMVVPLSIINHFKPMRHLAPEQQLHELFPYGTEHSNLGMPFDKKFFTWKNFFLRWDRGLKFADTLPWKPFRKTALKKAEAWMLERITEGSDGLGAIFPSMMYTCMVLRTLGYSEDHPLVRKAVRDFLDLEVNDTEKDEFRVQPCLSPIWDCAITVFALSESGIAPDHPALQKAGKWILSKEVNDFRGDWKYKNPTPVTSGWAFEYNNKFYPDVDDTFKVLLALGAIKMPDEAAKEKVMQRALEWAISFQCKNGGFAAFDKDVTKKWLQDVPFADHNAILDPPCSDITARALEVFGRMGLSLKEPVVQRAIKFVRDTQLPDGSWEGRWGVNYIYGTWLVLRGLKAAGVDMNQDWILRGLNWLESCQNADGGWGESPATYDNPRLKGQGESTPSQTAWALMGIIAATEHMRPSIRGGVEHLANTQNADGSWTEDHITGTGFPKVFYLKYDMYRNNWPLLALADFHRLAARDRR